jgi:hypothetical protein
LKLIKKGSNLLAFQIVLPGSLVFFNGEEFLWIILILGILFGYSIGKKYFLDGHEQKMSRSKFIFFGFLALILLINLLNFSKTVAPYAFASVIIGLFMSSANKLKNVIMK